MLLRKVLNTYLVWLYVNNNKLNSKVVFSLFYFVTVE